MVEGKGREGSKGSRGAGGQSTWLDSGGISIDGCVVGWVGEGEGEGEGEVDR